MLLKVTLLLVFLPLDENLSCVPWKPLQWQIVVQIFLDTLTWALTAVCIVARRSYGNLMHRHINTCEVTSINLIKKNIWVKRSLDHVLGWQRATFIWSHDWAF